MTSTAPEGGRRTTTSGVPHRSRPDRSLRSLAGVTTVVGALCATAASPVAAQAVAAQAPAGSSAGTGLVAAALAAPASVPSTSLALTAFTPTLAPDHRAPLPTDPGDDAQRPVATDLLAQAVAPGPAPQGVPAPATIASGASSDAFRLSFAPHAWHRSQSDDHVKWNNFVGLEYATARWTFWRADRALVGFAAGDNSFGQFSQYVYFGQEWDLWRLGPGRVFANVTAGLLHGYRDEHQDKIPFNRFGIAPVIVPAAGWRVGRFAIGANLLGANGVLFFGSVGFDLR